MTLPNKNSSHRKTSEKGINEVLQLSMIQKSRNPCLNVRSPSKVVPLSIVHEARSNTRCTGS